MLLVSLQLACGWIYDNVKAKIDPHQFGGIKDSSTSLALIKMVDFIAKETNIQKVNVRMLICDFSKAFDLEDHQIVLEKLHSTEVKWTGTGNSRSRLVTIHHHL